MDLYANFFFSTALYVRNRIRLYKTIFQLQAKTYFVQITLRQAFVKLYHVKLGDTVFWMRQFISQITIIGHKQQTGCITIEATNGVNAFFAGFFYQVHYRASFLRVICSGDIVFWFI